MLTKGFPMWKPYRLMLEGFKNHSNQFMLIRSMTTSKPESMKSHGQSITPGTLQFSTRPEAVKISQWLHDAWKKQPLQCETATGFALEMPETLNWMNELWIMWLWVMRQTNKSFTCTWQHRLLKTFKIFGQDIEVDRFPYKSTQVDIGSPS